MIDKSIQNSRWDPWLNSNKLLAVLVAIVLLYGMFFSAVGISRYNNLEAGGDFAFFVQVLSNHQHGLFFYTTLEDGGRSALGTHVALITLPLAWILWPFPLAEGMIVLQSALGSATALLLYWIAAQRKIPPLFCFLAGMAWLLAPHVQGAWIFDFHTITIAPFFFFLGILLFERDSRFYASCAFVFAAFCQEEMALLLAFLALVFYFQQKNRRFAVGLFLGSVGYFLLAYKVIIPWALGDAQTTFAYSFADFERNPFNWLYEHFTQPSQFLALLPSHKIYNYLHLFAAYAFLPLLAGWSILLLIPPLGIQLIATSPLMTLLDPTLPNQYGIVPMIAISYAALDGMQRLLRFSAGPKRYYSYFILFLLGLSVVVHSHVFAYYRPTQFVSVASWKSLLQREERAEWIRQILAPIEPSERIVTTRLLKPHLADRPTIWEWVMHERSYFPQSLDFADTLIVDVRYLRNNDQRGLLELIDCLEKRPFGVTFFDKDLVIAQRDHPQNQNSEVIAALRNHRRNQSTLANQVSIQANQFLLTNCDSLEGWSPQPAIYLDTINPYEGTGCVARAVVTDGLDRNFWFDYSGDLASLEQSWNRISLAIRSEHWECTGIDSISLFLPESIYIWHNPIPPDPTDSGERVQILSNRWKLLTLPFSEAQTSDSSKGIHTIEIKIRNLPVAPPKTSLISVDTILLQSAEE